MKGRSTEKLTVYSPEGDEFEVEATYDWWYDAGVMYYKDGSGCPPDWGVELHGYSPALGKDFPEWVSDDLVNEAFEQAYADGTIGANAHLEYEPDFEN